jgi:nucleobase:cation symporter-1, NCS1 family
MHMPTVIRDFTLVAIAVGAIAANALNIYSGAMSFLAAGIKIPFSLRRAIVALGFGVIGFFVAWSALPNAGQEYENFLLVIAYWIAPWLGIVLVDRYLRRGTQIGALVTEQAKYRNAAGIVSFVIAAVISIWLFSNQTIYVGLVPATFKNVGDLTAIVGFVLAGALYLLFFRLFQVKLGSPSTGVADVVVGVDAADEVA